MTHPVTLRITKKESGVSNEVTAEFNEREWRQLNAYIRYAEELFGVKLVNSESFSTFKWSWSGEHGMEVIGELPPWDDVKVFLHTLRPLILDEEYASFKNVSSILGKHLEDDYFRGIVKRARQVYELKKLQSMFIISIGKGMILNSEAALKVWLNADEYHTDEDKQVKLNHIEQMVSHDGARAMFLQLLREKTNAILIIYQLVALVVGKKSETIFDI